MQEKKVPASLKTWFIIHFVADVLFAIPLLLFPSAFLTLLGWQTIDPFATRIVAAALFGIGIESFLGRNADLQTYKNMLNLKIIWSGATIIGIGLTVLQAKGTVIPAQWLVLLTFIVFHFLWIYWRRRVGQALQSS